MRTIFAIILTFFFLDSNAQLGGNHSFQFLTLPISARTTGLGGTSISVADEDVAFGYMNPALLSSKTDKVLSVNYDFHLAGIGNGYLAYGKAIDRWGINAHAGINFITYGQFDRADIYGNRDGTFTGSEVALVIGGSKAINEKFTAGANMKLIFGALDTYNSFGTAIDLGGRCQTTGGATLGFSIQNLGTTWSDYGLSKRRLPLNVQVGLSKKLKHLPFRYTITAHNLQTWQIRYIGSDDVLINGKRQEKSPISKGVDNIFSHLIVSGEFLFGKKETFKIRMGYNHLRRQELNLRDFRSLAGFSAGFGISFKGFRLDYGLGYYHLAGANNHLSISTSLDRINKKIKI